MSSKKKPQANLNPVWARITHALGTTQQNIIAEKLGVRPPSVWKWTKGNVPGRETLLKIAQIGGTTVEWLLTGNETSETSTRLVPVPDHELAVMFYKWDELSEEDKAELRVLVAMIDREIEQRLKR